MTTKELAAEIRKAIKSAKPRTLADIASAADIDYHRLGNMQYGKASATADELDRLRKVLGLADYWPSSPPHLQGARKGELVSLAGTPLVSIPVVGNVSAGAGLYNVDNELMTVNVPATIDFSDCVGFIIDGDSMMTLLEEFDTAVFRKVKRRVGGYLYLVKIPELGYMVKLLTYDRGEWYLVSLNEKYERIPLPFGTEFLGYLVGIYRVRGTLEFWMVDPEGIRPPFGF